MKDIKVSKDFGEDSLTYVVPLDADENYSDGEGNIYVTQGSKNSNSYSYPPVNVDIPE